MSETTPTLHIAAQFTKEASFVSLVRPYENKSPVSVSFEMQARHERLPQPGHWRVELDVTLQGKGGDTLLYTAAVSQEFIVVVSNLRDEALAQVLRLQIPARMFAYARSQMTSLSLNTGYGPLTLPPVPDAYILQANKSETES